MALVNCKECRQEVSQKAGSCPKCGAPIKKKISRVTWGAAIIGGFGLIGYLGSLGTTSSNSPTASNPAPSVGINEQASDRSSDSSLSPSNSELSKAKTTAKNYRLGETAHVGYASYSVWEVFYRSELSNNSYINQPPDAAYLFVNLTVRNNDKKARTIPPFKLVDENGAEYERSSKGWLVDGSIGVLDSLNPSVEKRGYIVFDVPRGRHYKLELSGGYWSSEKAFVDLNLNAP